MRLGVRRWWDLEHVIEIVEPERDGPIAADGLPLAGRCECSCADSCPLGRTGSRPRCTAPELRVALIEMNMRMADLLAGIHAATTEAEKCR